jgi:hypothetical protein
MRTRPRIQEISSLGLLEATECDRELSMAIRDRDLAMGDNGHEARQAAAQEGI